MFAIAFKFCLLCIVASSPTTKEGEEIIGGEEIDIRQAPYQIALFTNGSFNCGGSVVNNNFIVTAAHCVKFVEIGTLFSIRAGSSNRKQGGHLVNVTSTLVHPKFSTIPANYDIAILRLAVPLRYSDKIRPIEMADVGEEVPDGADTAVSGWGLTDPNGQLATILRRAVVQKVNDMDCNRTYEGLITENMMCAGVQEGDKNACHGDSGGPLVYNSKLVGITSWNHYCQPGYPTVYTKVSALRKWIDENIRMIKLVDGKDN